MEFLVKATAAADCGVTMLDLLLRHAKALSAEDTFAIQGLLNAQYALSDGVEVFWVKKEQPAKLERLARDGAKIVDETTGAKETA